MGEESGDIDSTDLSKACRVVARDPEDGWQVVRIVARRRKLMLDLMVYQLVCGLWKSMCRFGDLLPNWSGTVRIVSVCFVAWQL